MLMMIQTHHTFLFDINTVLERYGRTLYDADKNGVKFAECFNAITIGNQFFEDRCRVYEIGFNLEKHEPGTRHSTMPGPVKLVVVSQGILWGWMLSAAVIALVWSSSLELPFSTYNGA